MSQVMPPEVARQLLSDPVVRQRLLPLMPEGLGDDEESMVGVVSSPQFQQVLYMFIGCLGIVGSVECTLYCTYCRLFACLDRFFRQDN